MISFRVLKCIMERVCTDSFVRAARPGKALCHYGQQGNIQQTNNKKTLFYFALGSSYNCLSYCVRKHFYPCLDATVKGSAFYSQIAIIYFCPIF